MSFAIPATDLTAAITGSTGTVDWTKLAQSGGFASQQSASLTLLNESPCGLQLSFATGEQIALPAGGWQTVTLQPNCTRFSYSVLYVLNASPIVAKLLGTWYAPGEAVPNTPILGNSPIGGNVTNSTANQIEGTGQTLPVTTLDGAIGPNLIPASHPIGQGATIGIESLLSSGLPGNSLILDGSIAASAGARLSSKFVSYNGDTLATSGNGLAVIPTLTLDQSVSVTTLTQIAQLTVGGNNALYRVTPAVRLNNGTSGQLITFQVSYTDSGGTARTDNFLLQAALGVTAANGSNSFGNAFFPGDSKLLSVQASSTITANYRDPGGTPNDLVTVVIERLA